MVSLNNMQEKKIEDSIKIRENIEWINYWIEDANKKERNRILVIGDSVARDYRTVLNKILQTDNYVVDLLATSYCILDMLLIKEIKSFIDTVGYQYKYQYIIFNLGAHHGYSIKCTENEDIQKVYYCILEEIFNNLKELSTDIIAVSGTPENIYVVEENNNEIEERNRILERFCSQYGFRFIDIYKPLFDRNCYHIDIFHYSEEGNEYIAYMLAEALGFKNNKISSRRISNLKGFLGLLKNTHKIYIYGDGKRGRLLYKYLNFMNYKLNDKYIVSDEFYQKNNREQVLLRDLIKDCKENDLVLVTSESKVIWEMLNKMQLNYSTLDKRLYVYIEEYVNAYIDV